MPADDPVARADALLEAIYESAVEPAAWQSLREHMLKNFRYDARPNPRRDSFLDAVLGHIQRALKIAETRQRLQWERRQLAELIDAIAPAVCVMRADRSIVGINPAAQRTLRVQAEQVLSGHFLPECERAAFENTLDEAIREGHGCLRVRAGERGDTVLLHVARLSTRPVELFSVVLFERDAALRQAIEQFAELFRLTCKERRVVEQAIRQPRLDSVADAEDIGYHTARQHLKSVYAKTGAHNQAELVAALLRQSIVQEAARTHDATLLPHLRGLAQSHFVNVGNSERPRQLCYADHGDPAGIPVLYFHTIFGSRLELFVHDELLRSQGIRLIAIDRPGFGHSDFYEYADYNAYTRDVARLLDALDLGSVGILSCSAGTPHAVACAANLADRVSQVHCTGSIAPIEHVSAAASRSVVRRIHSNLFRIAPGLLRPALELMLRGQTVESLYRLLIERPATVMRSSQRDVEFISQPGHLDYFIAFTIESLRQGTQAMAKEGAMVNNDWGISYRGAQCPIRFWHGDQDELVPKEMIQSFANALPRGRMTLLEAETHLLIFRHLEQILPAFRSAA